MYNRRLCWLLLIPLAVLGTSCDVINPEETIPTYIELSDYDFEVQPGQGTNEQKISSFYVIVDNNLQGVYPYPSQVPLLLEEDGMHQVVLGAGVEMNGIGSNNQEYTILKRDTFNIQKQPGEVLQINPRLEYIDDAVFEFIEDFDTGSELSLDVDTDSETNLERVTDTVFQGSHSAKLEVDTVHPVMEVASFDRFNLPKSGVNIFLELHYRNTVEFSVGLLAEDSNSGATLKVYKVRFRTRDEWNKVYINMRDEVQQINADEFRVLVGTSLPQQGDRTTGSVHIDNIKLLHR